jgi:transposase-like protein
VHPQPAEPKIAELPDCESGTNRGLSNLVQSRRDRRAAQRLMRKLLRKHGRTPRVLITDKLKSYAAAN